MFRPNISYRILVKSSILALFPREIRFDGIIIRKYSIPIKPKHKNDSSFMRKVGIAGGFMLVCL